MPMMAPNSIPTKNSVNIMAFLLQKNGVPAGAKPLDDTVDLSKAASKIAPHPFDSVGAWRRAPSCWWLVA
jgi:hypothetical protein